jgi:hypothetical protein
MTSSKAPVQMNIFSVHHDHMCCSSERTAYSILSKYAIQCQVFSLLPLQRYLERYLHVSMKGKVERVDTSGSVFSTSKIHIVTQSQLSTKRAAAPSVKGSLVQIQLRNRHRVAVPAEMTRFRRRKLPVQGCRPIICKELKASPKETVKDQSDIEDRKDYCFMKKIAACFIG